MTIMRARHRNRSALVAICAVALSWMVAAPVAGSAGAPAGSPGAIVDPALRIASGTVGVIVQGTHSVESSIRQMGGRITHHLPLIGGFSARVPAGDVDRIAHLPGATALTLDRRTHVQALPESTPGSTNAIPSVYKKATHGDALATAGARGQGVTVALIDTGVTSMPDIAGAIQRVSGDALGLTTRPCVNFTDEPTCDDSYGHGTFMAGLIAGDGTSSVGKYVGMAPRAKILSLKIAGASGASDVSTIIAALQWVVQWRDTYGIRVLNLSLGTDSTQSYTVDPLDYAVEKVWQSGIVVNVAASNRGPAAETISDPANDPFVITVGAIDDKGTSGLGDDVLPDFSGRGPTATDHLAKPDVAAPGAHLVSLAAPDATITTQFPSTMTAPYRRGSGTSMANAVVTGLVAQMLSAQPTMSPDRVKYALMSTVRHDGASTDPLAVGAGVVDGSAALTAGPGLANAGVAPSMGTGSLAASRGTGGVVLDDLTGTVLDASNGDVSTLAGVDGTSWWGTSWWGASTNGVSSSTEDYGTSWWGGAWYGAWDQ